MSKLLFFYLTACCMYSLTIVLLQHTQDNVLHSSCFHLIFKESCFVHTSIIVHMQAFCWSPNRIIVLVSILWYSQKQYGNHLFCIIILMLRNIFEWPNSYEYTQSGAVQRGSIKQWFYQQTQDSLISIIALHRIWDKPTGR